MLLKFFCQAVELSSLRFACLVVGKKFQTYSPKWCFFMVMNPMVEFVKKITN